jgi:hypothetical protein
MTSEQTYTILETKLKESLDEQIDIQSVDIDDIMKQSLMIKELSEALNDIVDDDPLVYSDS